MALSVSSASNPSFPEYKNYSRRDRRQIFCIWIDQWSGHVFAPQMIISYLKWWEMYYDGVDRKSIEYSLAYLFIHFPQHFSLEGQFCRQINRDRPRERCRLAVRITVFIAKLCECTVSTHCSIVYFQYKFILSLYHIKLRNSISYIFGEKSVNC